MTTFDETSGSAGASITMDADASAHACGMLKTHGSTDAIPPAKRGPGRPKGSPNKPKPPPMSPIDREALKDELGARYRKAIVARMLAETRAKGIVSLIRERLGRHGLAEVQAEIIREREARNAPAAPASDEARINEAA